MFDVFARIEEGGVTNSYHWTEGAGATGTVDFNPTAATRLDSVNNLGKENCPSSYCGSGFNILWIMVLREPHLERNSISNE